jgi:transposase
MVSHILISPDPRVITEFVGVAHPGRAFLTARVRTVQEALCKRQQQMVIPAPASRPRSTGECSISVLHYVLRTGEGVILDDAATEPAFAADPYIRERRRACGVLKVPLNVRGPQLRLRRLMAIPYVRPIAATAIAALVLAPKGCRAGPNFAACLGVTQVQKPTGEPRNLAPFRRWASGPSGAC